MNKQLKTAPEFASEAQERAYWESHDSTAHLDWQVGTMGRQPVGFNNRFSKPIFSKPMSKAFTKETDSDDEELPPPLPVGGKNYITPRGYARLKAELLDLIDTERPKVVEIVHWAASNGDRSENGDYIYGKKRLREIDRRIRFLTQRLEIAEIADPSVHHGGDQVFFGATVLYLVDGKTEQRVTIMGIDEADSSAGEISWVSPAARTLLKARVGDEVNLVTPSGVQVVEVLEVSYPAPPTTRQT